MEHLDAKAKRRKTNLSIISMIAGLLIFISQQLVIINSKHAGHHVRELQQQEMATAGPPVLGRQPCLEEKESTRAASFGRTMSSGEQKLRFNSSDATVLAMGQGYEVGVHRRFVGSLRMSGFEGKIILATESELKEGVEEYLLSKNVTILRLNYTECVHKILEDHEVKTHKDKECNTCIAPYNDVKIRWGRFPLLRDALINCKECTGPVLVTDVRDTLFQRDPFGDGAPEIEGLHLYAEWRIMNAANNFIRKPIRQCKKVEMNESLGPMLCSGTTIGTRATMIGYLDTMYNEMVEWMKDKNCWSKKAGGDQAIHNYLQVLNLCASPCSCLEARVCDWYYTGKFDHLNPRVFEPREQIVNTVGAKGVQFSKIHEKNNKEKKMKAHKYPWIMSEPEEGRWLPLVYDVTDTEGYFIDFNGERSRVVHQYDRFGNHAQAWLNRNEGKIWD